MTQTRSIHRSRRAAASNSHIERQIRRAVVDTLVRIGLAAEPGPPLLLTRAAAATAPSQMAATQASDPAERVALVASYERCLDGYRRMVAGGDTEVDDLGRAVAFFAAANLHALHGVDAEASLLVPLEQQLRGLARVRSNWDQASIAERQTFFERIAILSMVITTARSRAAGQDAAALADVRRTARQYLQELLGLNPDLLTLGAGGLTAREDAAAAPFA
jgi:hypothetical protein